MTLRFLLGRAGTGKTEHCLRETRTALKEAPLGPPILLLVPEQATFQIEHALTNTPGLESVFRAQVISFRRLAYRVLQETGGASRVPIGELGKRMVLRHLLEQHKGRLRAFAGSTDKAGFADSLARAIGELKLYQIGPDSLKERAEQLGGSIGALSSKLMDLSLIYKDFEEFLKDRYTDPDDCLTLLADKLSQSALVRDAEVWVDGFTGFTPQEFSVIDSLLKNAKRVNIALCIDPKEIEQDLNEENLFFPTWETFREIYRRAERAKVPIEPPVILEPKVPERFAQSQALAFVEQRFFSYPTGRMQSYEGIKVAAGVNRRAEVEAAAREIIYLCRSKGLRWKDVAVLLRDMGPYEDLISGIFKEYGIPFFIDNKRDMLHHPMVELVRSLVEIVLKDWAYEPMFRCLKTDLLPISREETDLLENYVLAHGIRGLKRWAAGDWKYLRRYTLGEDSTPSELEAAELELVNGIRQRVVSCLEGFSLGLRRAANAVEITTIIYQLIESLGIGETLQEWALEAQNRGALEEAREHLQVWDALVSLFDELVEAMGGDAVSLENYLAVLESGLESLRLGMIPPGLDQVVIGSMDRSRNANTKAVFILGANEGIFPARQIDEGLFNDAERQHLRENGMSLAPGGRRKAFDEQYLIYLALTRAREMLWISYAMADEEGRALAPSSVVKGIKEMFPQLTETLYQVEPDPQKISEVDISYVVSTTQAFNYLASGLRELRKGRVPASPWWDLYNYFTSVPEAENKLELVLQGVFHTNQEQKLSPEVGRFLYGSPIRASVSQIEKYNACPFAHFASYGLKLRERQLYRLAAPDMGEFFHAALKLFCDRLRENEMDWGDLTEKVCTDLTGQIVEELAPQLQSEILLSTARFRYLTGKLRKNVNRAVLVLAEHARRGTFRPVGVEISFGPGAQMPPVTIELSEASSSIELVGRIDRVDVARKEDKDYLRVIDYKSSDNKISLDEIYYGLRLQLLTYLHVALSHSVQLIGRQGFPGGILYFTVKEPLIPTAGPMPPELVEKERLKMLKMQGFLLGDPEVVKMMDDRLSSGWSELLPVALNKDGAFYSASSVVSNENFQILRCYLQEVFQQAGKAILDGDIAIEPYKYRSLTACIYCSFKPVCQFDLLLEENKFRALKKLTQAQVWQYLSKREVE